MLNRPPPYFPQNQLSPPDENRYRRFKLIIAGVVIGGIILVAALITAIYFLVTWLMR